MCCRRSSPRPSRSSSPRRRKHTFHRCMCRSYTGCRRRSPCSWCSNSAPERTHMCSQFRRSCPPCTPRRPSSPRLARSILSARSACKLSSSCCRRRWCRRRRHCSLRLDCSTWFAACSCTCGTRHRTCPRCKCLHRRSHRRTCSSQQSSNSCRSRSRRRRSRPSMGRCHRSRCWLHNTRSRPYASKCLWRCRTRRRCRHYRLRTRTLRPDSSH